MSISLYLTLFCLSHSILSISLYLISISIRILISISIWISLSLSLYYVYIYIYIYTNTYTYNRCISAFIYIYLSYIYIYMSLPNCYRWSEMELAGFPCRLCTCSEFKVCPATSMDGTQTRAARKRGFPRGKRQEDDSSGKL